MAESERCISCDQNLADFNEDFRDYVTLSESLKQLQGSEQRGDDVLILEIPEIGSWTVLCYWCENYRICSEFLRGAINPLLQTIIRFSEDDISSLPEVKKGLQLIGKIPQFKMHSHDAELQELVCKVASVSASDIARNLLNFLGHSTLTTSETPQIESECGQSHPANGTCLLEGISWNVRNPVETAHAGDELDLDVFPDPVTLLASDGYDSQYWEIRVTDTSVRGILQSIHEFYAKYEAEHGENDPMGDGVLFKGLLYIMEDDVWSVSLGSRQI